MLKNAGPELIKKILEDREVEILKSLRTTAVA